MTDEQINAAIAEACGWTEIIHTPHDPQPPKGRESRGTNWGKPIPNYCNDLNAMHEAEKVLEEKKLVKKYELTLGRNGGNRFEWSKIHATARQRAEALLRTLGKFKE